ncbi:hypothetical protein PM082_007300 [Marasmius tenuissimus]|nr:hypothetical protein PM082_007300 [Marasmius tenuissimus]
MGTIFRLGAMHSLWRLVAVDDDREMTRIRTLVWVTYYFRLSSEIKLKGQQKLSENLVAIHNNLMLILENKREKNASGSNMVLVCGLPLCDATSFAQDATRHVLKTTFLFNSFL